MQIIQKGYRGVYESQAVCWEKTAGDFKKEFNRKVRIVNRSFSGLLRVKSVLNPFKTGIFCLEVISHKLLRWFVPFFLLSFAASSATLSICDVQAFRWITVSYIIFLWCAYIGHLFSSYSRINPIFYFPYYFIVVNIASLVGVFRSLKGEVQTTWDTSRITDEKGRTGEGWVNFLIHFAAAILIWFFLVNVGKLSVCWTC